MGSKQVQAIALRIILGAAITGVVVTLPLATSAQTTRPNAAINPQQVPTARYGRGEPVDLSLIVEEWRDRYPDIPVFVCSCNAETCGNAAVWPYRQFTQYQPTLALGPGNATNRQATGFNCFDMETGDAP